LSNNAQYLKSNSKANESTKPSVLNWLIYGIYTINEIVKLKNKQASGLEQTVNTKGQKKQEEQRNQSENKKTQHSNLQQIDWISGVNYQCEKTKLGKYAFKIEALINNPKQFPLIIQYPYMTISYKGVVMAKSPLREEKVELLPFSKINMFPFYLEIQHDGSIENSFGLFARLACISNNTLLEIAIHTHLYGRDINTSYVKRVRIKI
jgi:hypothetical protein